MLLLTYKDNKNSYLEEKIATAAEDYKGKVKSDFNFEYGSFSVSVEFKNRENEQAFCREISMIAQKMGVEVDYGGTV